MKIEKQDQHNPYLSDYRLPLVWIDLEMTGEQVECVTSRVAKLSISTLKLLVKSFVCFHFAGLNIELDRILEIACIITDGNLTKSVEVYNYLMLHFACLLFFI